MFFFEMEVWREYAEELGIARVIRDLEARGKVTTWVTKVVDPGEFGSVFEEMGKPHYRSGCPSYEGYWLHGGTGAVQCRAAGELLPGVVWYNICEKRHDTCPFCKGAENDE